MGKFFNKIRQVFNIFLIMLLIGLGTAVFVYFLTSPEQRGVTFWISAGFLIFALVLETLMCAGIAMRSNGGKNVTSGFTQVILGGVYFLFVIVMAVGNAVANFSVVKYMLIHIGGLIVFLVPMILINMATLRLSGADRKEREEGRINLSSLANKVSYVVDDLIAGGMSRQDLTQLVNLSEAIKYSDPTPASRKLERDLEDAVNNLEKVASGKEISEISRACTLVERALRERNEAVINSK